MTSLYPFWFFDCSTTLGTDARPIVAIGFSDLPEVCSNLPRFGSWAQLRGDHVYDSFVFNLKKKESSTTSSHT